MGKKQNYERPICVRLKDEEFNAICRYISSASGVERHTLKRGEFSDGARKLLMNGISSKKQEPPKQPIIDRELALDIREEIRKIGTNVNQLARSMNAIFNRREYISNATANKVTKSLDMSVQHLDDIMKRVIDLSK